MVVWSFFIYFFKLINSFIYLFFPLNVACSVRYCSSGHQNRPRVEMVCTAQVNKDSV